DVSPSVAGTSAVGTTDPVYTQRQRIAGAALDWWQRQQVRGNLTGYKDSGGGLIRYHQRVAGGKYQTYIDMGPVSGQPGARWGAIVPSERAENPKARRLAPSLLRIPVRPGDWAEMAEARRTPAHTLKPVGLSVVVVGPDRLSKTAKEAFDRQLDVTLDKEN